jgi:hypothetical protein
LLFEKRNITIHGTGPSVRGEIQATITEKISISESVNLLYAIRMEISNNNQIQKRIKRSILILQKVLSVLNGSLKIILMEKYRCCHSLLERMKDFVKKIHEKFPVEHSAA